MDALEEMMCVVNVSVTKGCCSDCVGVCVNGCCVADVVKDSFFF